ncbi:ABC transporter G family member 23-like isoform X2 [Convolutriloba macropyga]
MEEPEARVTKTQSEPGELAISVHRAHKSYRGAKQPVLNGLNMTVEQGSIYGLLGPSGCGKTTLLKCIIGIYSLERGKIRVFGYRTPCDNNELQIPGKDIGYMPQELALYFNFRISELFHFYGQASGMSTSQILQQSDFLSELLHLPDNDRIIGTLSGGQKRLVSFGTAMIHDPKLMILDEPTVGVDPVLSAKIWRHLEYLVSNRGTTIIITTHYIEEARQAKRVGLMRAGRLLCEDEPETLIKKEGKKNLEEVFLDLCKRSTSPPLSIGDYGDEELSKDDDTKSETESISSDGTKSTTGLFEPKSKRSSWFAINFTIFYACIFREIIIILRDIPTLMFNFVTPAIQLSVFLLGVGGNPKGLKIGIVNEDLAQPETSISNQFIRYLDRGDWGDLKRYGSIDSAKNAADDADVDAIFHFMPNFTSAMIKKVQNPGQFTSRDANNSNVYLTLDGGSPLNNDVIWGKASFTYDKIERQLLNQYSSNGVLETTGVFISEPMFKEVDSFTEYAAPGTMLYVIFVLACLFSSTRLVSERKQGLIERLSICGITGNYIVLSMAFVQAFILMIQTGVFLLTGVVIFGVPLEGKLPLAIMFIFFEGMAGLMYGILASVMCTEEAQVFQIVYGMTSIMMMISGILWPLNALPPILQG